MPNGDPQGQIFLSLPHTHDGFLYYSQEIVTYVVFTFVVMEFMYMVVTFDSLRPSQQYYLAMLEYFLG